MSAHGTYGTYISLSEQRLQSQSKIRYFSFFQHSIDFQLLLNNLIKESV